MERLIRAIIKRPGLPGIQIHIENSIGTFRALLDGKEIDDIEVQDFAVVFNAENQAEDVRPFLAPAFGSGYETRVTYNGKYMQLNDLRGPVVIVGVEDGQYADAPARLQRIARDMI